MLLLLFDFGVSSVFRKNLTTILIKINDEATFFRHPIKFELPSPYLYYVADIKKQ